MKNPGELPPIPYPLTRRIRLTIMLSLIGLFCIISPAVLLLARGFRFDFATKTLTHGGALSIETSPPGTTVSLSDIELKEKSPYRIPTLIPGNYHVKISKEGYYTWEKNITIQSNQTTYLHNVDLFRTEAPELLNLTEKRIVTLLKEQNNNTEIFMTQEENTYEIFSYDAGISASTFLTRVNSITPPHIEWSPDGKNIRIESFFNDHQSVMLLPIATPTVFQTHSFEKNTTSSLQWDTRASTVWFQEKNTLKKLDTDNQKPVFLVSTSTLAWYVEGDTLWESTPNTLRATREGKVIVEEKIERPIQKLIDINQNRIVAFSNGRLIILKLQNGTVASTEDLPAVNWYFLKNQNIFLVWYDGELRSVNQNGDVAFINRFSSEIKDVQEITPLGTLLIVTENLLFTFHPNYFVPQTLLGDASVESVSINEEKREIYFLGTKGEVHGVWRMEF